jgi:RNA polymerase sigma factor (sigma-70 family)
MAYNDEHFRQFAGALDRSIKRFWSRRPESLFLAQKKQVETLVKLERQFKLTLIKHSAGVKVYQAFIDYICKTRRNILDARPYFRERQDVFTRDISRALRSRGPRALYRFSFNYRFVQFALGAYKWKPRSPIVLLAKKIRALRDELVTTNMPLAISRARIFYSRTPKAHLEHMDLVQIACEGLMSCVDKFVPPFSRAFRAVAIGRMTGNFIEQYSETPIHFYPREKRKIYRANKYVGRHAGANPEDIAKEVNKGVEKAHWTTPSEIANLMAAASVVSADAQTQEDEAGVVPTRQIERYAAPEDVQPDVIAERQDAYGKLNQAQGQLSVTQRKCLQLWGVQVDSL